MSELAKQLHLDKPITLMKLMKTIDAEVYGVTASFELTREQTAQALEPPVSTRTLQKYLHIAAAYLSSWTKLITQICSRICSEK